MTPQFQTVAALLVVACAAGWLVHRFVSKRAKPGCGGDCGCPASDLREKIRTHDQAGTRM